MKLSQKSLETVLQWISHTHAEEIDCGTCWEQVDQFAELVLAGKDASEALPLVRDHLVLCAECRDEYEALLAALLAMQDKPSTEISV